MSFLTLSHVNKRFGANTVVRDFCLEVERGEFLSFLGPSGCGKTTVLRMIAGFETPTAGAITIGGRDVTAVPANRRRIGMVFQAYALFPNMTVRGNVAFGLKIAGQAKPAIAARVAEMLALIGLDHLADRYPWQLSGGQQQRVALARALAPRPAILLADEPTGNLDEATGRQIADLLFGMVRDSGTTLVLVTHAPELAVRCDRTIRLRDGRLEQAA